jgi:hypothetical protein
MKRLSITIVFTCLMTVLAYLFGEWRGRREATLELLRLNHQTFSLVSKATATGDWSRTAEYLRFAEIHGLEERLRFLSDRSVWRLRQGSIYFGSFAPRKQEADAVAKRLDEIMKKAPEPSGGR